MDPRKETQMAARKYPNWHVTWSGGASSDGACLDLAPGAHGESEVEGRSADCVVAPGDFVTRYCAELDPEGRYPGTPAEAVRVWARERGIYCG